MKSNNYHHLNQSDRDRIQALLDTSSKQKEIADIIGVDKSTISREIARNRRKRIINPGKYESSVANHKAYLRRYYSKYQGKKINDDSGLKEYIINGLELGWSPDEISGRIKAEKKPFYSSKTAIYEWLYTDQGKPWCQCLYTRRKRKRKKQPKTKKALIPNRIGLESRPLGATNRSRYGHHEGDTMVSSKKTGSKAALSVLYERKARFVDAQKIKDLKPINNNQAIKQMEEKYSRLKSLTFDNGVENTKHEELNLPTFFCDPYSSWQKGGVENAIKMIRRYIPKGTDLNQYSDEEIEVIIDIINNKPRKSLGYKTAYEVMVENNLLKKPEVALRG